MEAELDVGSSSVSDEMVCLRDRRRAVDVAGMVVDEEERGASARGNGKGKCGMSSGSSKMPLPVRVRGRTSSRAGGDA